MHVHHDHPAFRLSGSGKKIHAADGAAFAKEATSGANPDLKAFAAETYRIVQRHLGELGAKVH
jgi:hypothetical protein